MNFLRVTLLGALGLACCTAVHADDPLWRHFYVVETFRLPMAEGVDLVSQNLKGKDMHNRVLAATKAGTAALTNLMVLRSGRASRSILSQTDEYFYPTEFDPPQLPQILALVDPGPGLGTATPDQAVSPAPAPAAEPLVRSPFNAGLGILTTTTPTAFEMTHLGEVLTLEQYGSNPLVLNFSLESQELLSERMYGDIPSPLFAPKKMEHRLRLVSGEPAFVGSQSTPQREGIPEAAAKTLLLTFITIKSEPLPPVIPPEQDAFSKVYTSTRATLEVISVDKATAHALLLEQPADAVVHARLTALVDQQQARRETVLATRFRPGNRAVVESADRYIYPTEFDPPQVPQHLILANHELLQDLRAGRQTGVGALPAKAGGNTSGGFGLITTLSPTAFEMTSTGERLELEVAQTNDEFDAELSVVLRRLSGNVIYNGIPHPVFEVQSLNTNVHLRPGEPTLVGTLNKPLHTGWKDVNTEDRVWLAFLRVTAK